MKKFILLLLFLSISLVSAIPTTEVSYFYSATCLGCQAVSEDEVLDRVALMEGVSVQKYEVEIPANREKYLDYLNRLDIKQGVVPFSIISQKNDSNQELEFSYIMGDISIIADLENFIVNFQPMKYTDDVNRKEISLWVVVGAALIDSINPCAFGVLLFLMAVLLSMGSAKRALKSGLIYTFVIFLVYLSAGLGIMRFASDFLILDSVKIFVAVLILIMAAIEIKDFFWEGKGISLAIPKSAKPWLEKYARRGTLLSLIVLGVLVALVELPCTGGIYLAILSLIVESGTKGMFYLVLYNVIFILPLILISYFVYSGTKIESVNVWVQENKKFMRLAAGIVMLGLGLLLLGVL